MALLEFAILIMGMLFTLTYVGMRSGSIPYDIHGVLSLLFAAVWLVAVMGGWIGWIIALAIILDKKEKKNAGRTEDGITAGRG